MKNFSLNTNPCEVYCPGKNMNIHQVIDNSALKMSCKKKFKDEPLENIKTCQQSKILISNGHRLT